MEEVAKILGVKLGEPFNIKDRGVFNPYTLTDKGLINKTEDCADSTLSLLLSGKFTIEKIPFKPKYEDIYYFVDDDGVVCGEVFSNHMEDYYCYNAGNCFRTREEITQEDEKRILKEMKGKYDGK